MKRLFDVVGAVVGLVVGSPLMLAVWVAIKREDGGPVIYRQERVGLKGRSFTLYKFRSMTIEAEESGRPVLCMKEDNRLTRVGNFLRSHHIDEMPQLWNVLVGDMSIVGYRPERPFFVERIMEHNPRYAELYALRPGLFSLATLYNGYTDTMEKMLIRLDMDLHYLYTRSFWGDVKIIWLTLWTIATGKSF